MVVVGAVLLAAVVAGLIWLAVRRFRRGNRALHLRPAKLKSELAAEAALVEKLLRIVRSGDAAEGRLFQWPFSGREVEVLGEDSYVANVLAVTGPATKNAATANCDAVLVPYQPRPDEWAVAVAIGLPGSSSIKVAGHLPPRQVSSFMDALQRRHLGEQSTSCQGIAGAVLKGKRSIGWVRLHLDWDADLRGERQAGQAATS